MLLHSIAVRSAGRASFALLASLAVLIVVASAAPAQAGESVVYSFQGAPDSAAPIAGLVSDQHGALYGTTSSGGMGSSCAVYSGCGTVFMLTPPDPGHTHWTRTVLYSFCSMSNCADGEGPLGGLILDREGALYGTTAQGGNANNDGTVFKLTPPATGQTPWTESVLYSFQGGTDGAHPYAGLIFDQQGALYGTTQQGAENSTCSYGCGSVFKLTPPVAGGQSSWSESVIYSFCSLSGCTDGAYPASGLIFDREGALYGTNYSGGSVAHGTVFKLTPPAAGQSSWSESVLYSFCSRTNCPDGAYLYAGVIFDQHGALYGTTNSGGNSDSGTVFKLTPPTGGQTPWTESVLYSFCSQNSCSDGGFPQGGLILDQEGALYGTTEQGGNANDGGTVFKLTPPAAGQTLWTETVLHSFCSQNNCTDGASPDAGLIAGVQGALYGTTYDGGSGSCSGYGCGTVFRQCSAEVTEVFGGGVNSRCVHW